MLRQPDWRLPNPCTGLPNNSAALLVLVDVAKGREDSDEASSEPLPTEHRTGVVIVISDFLAVLAGAPLIMLLSRRKHRKRRRRRLRRRRKKPLEVSGSLE